MWFVQWDLPHFSSEVNLHWSRCHRGNPNTLVFFSTADIEWLHFLPRQHDYQAEWYQLRHSFACLAILPWHLNCSHLHLVLESFPHWGQWLVGLVTANGELWLESMNVSEICVCSIDFGWQDSTHPKRMKDFGLVLGWTIGLAMVKRVLSHPFWFV